jgi:hypothetical protein
MSGGVQQECDRTPGNESLEYIYTDAFYYVIVTMSSVGYGDYSPQVRAALNMPQILQY